MIIASLGLLACFMLVPLAILALRPTPTPNQVVDPTPKRARGRAQRGNVRRRNARRGVRVGRVRITYRRKRAR